MKLRFERLEGRDCPAIWTYEGKYANVGEWGTVFEDYHGPISMASSELTDHLHVHQVVAGAGVGGGPRVISGIIDDVQQPGGVYPIHKKFDQFVFEPAFLGGVSVALGDVNGDGEKDLILAAGAGGGPRVRVLDGNTFLPLLDFFAYSPSFTGGVSVASADFDQDGKAEIVTGPGVGGGPHVRIFNGNAQEVSGFISGDPSSREGVKVAAADVLYFDGTPEVVTLTDNLPNHTLRVHDFDGFQESGFAVLKGQTGPSTLGTGYLSQALVPHPVVAAGSIVESWDSHPLFPEGRRIAGFDLANHFQRPVSVQVGSATQLDGLARFDKSGVFQSTDFELYDANWPLSEPLDPAPGGAAIGPDTARQTGTLTGYVRDENGTTYALTNRHVVSVKHQDPVGSTIVQPGGAFPSSSIRPIGTVTNWIPLHDTNIADAALIRLNAQSDFDARHGYGRDDKTLGFVRTHGIGEAQKGKLVYKFGLWGTALGLVVDTGATIKVNDGGTTYSFLGQTVVAQADAGIGWIQPGDSGSLVTDAHGLRVGQAFAGNSMVGIFTPIEHVFEELGFHGAFVD